MGREHGPAAGDGALINSAGAGALDQGVGLYGEDDHVIIENAGMALYRRLHARDATKGEQAELVALAAGSSDEPPLSPRDFALLACFAVASSVESLFY